MFVTSKLKAHRGLCILCILIACFWLFFSNTNSTIIKSQDAQQIERLIPVETNQLQLKNGVIPVELRCEDAELSASDALEKLSCVIKNSTNKYISAAVVYISVHIEQEGRSSFDSSYLTIETFGHSDFREEHRNNLIPPRGERRLQDLPTYYNGAVIKGIKVWIDYVEFADNSAALGANHAGARIISDIRKGAAKYKEWLIQKYNQSGKSIDAIAPLLEKGQAISDEVGVQNGDQEQGAIFYRNYARKTYQTKGAAGLNRYLKQTSVPINK